MPLAVTALIRPSRLLRAVLAGYAMACLGAAVAMLASSRFHLASAGAAACLLAALLAARAAAAHEMRRVIDISGLGEIRLTVQQSVAGAEPVYEALTLLPGSTVWPHCLILLLRTQGTGSLVVLAILPDSLPAESFRHVSIAVRAVARRDNKFFEKNKIL